MTADFRFVYFIRMKCVVVTRLDSKVKSVVSAAKKASLHKI